MHPASVQLDYAAAGQQVLVKFQTQMVADPGPVLQYGPCGPSRSGN